MEDKNTDLLVEMVMLASLSEIEGPEAYVQITSLLDDPESLISAIKEQDAKKALELFKQ